MVGRRPKPSGSATTTTATAATVINRSVPSFAAFLSPGNFINSDCNSLLISTNLNEKVGGHTQFLQLDQSTVCKPLIPRELSFYLNAPPDIRTFTPQYKGTSTLQSSRPTFELDHFNWDHWGGQSYNLFCTFKSSKVLKNHLWGKRDKKKWLAKAPGRNHRPNNDQLWICRHCYVNQRLQTVQTAWRQRFLFSRKKWMVEILFCLLLQGNSNSSSSNGGGGGGGPRQWAWKGKPNLLNGKWAGR